jgi:hypothetical protein
LPGRFHARRDNPLQRLANARHIGLALRRQRNSIAAPQEDLEPQLVFKTFDALADGGGSYELLFSGAREILVPRSTLHDLQ